MRGILNVLLVGFLVGLMPESSWGRPPVNFSTLCPSLKNKPWKEIIQGAREFAWPINDSKSGVLNNLGIRHFFEKDISDCDGQIRSITLRFTLDEVSGQKSVYEVFVKNNDTGEVIGLALNDEGGEITSVPEAIALDKDKNYGEKASHRGIETREGCFRCHGNGENNVSLTYGVVYAQEFWRKAKPVVEFVQERPPVPFPNRNFRFVCTIDSEIPVPGTLSQSEIVTGKSAETLGSALVEACNACQSKNFSKDGKSIDRPNCRNPKCNSVDGLVSQDKVESEILRTPQSCFPFDDFYRSFRF